MDHKAGERKLKGHNDATPSKAQDPDASNAHLFEEFKRPAQPGEAPKPRGLNAQGYQFPPPQGPPAMTKENLAKGIGLPPSGNIVPPLPPPTELVAADPLFEEYQRPDLKKHPRTGTGIRSAPPVRSAKEILAEYNPPEPQVFTGRRLEHPNNTAVPSTRPEPEQPAHVAAEADAAHLDAESDLATAPELTMSHSRAHGPTKVHTDADPFAEMPNLPHKKPAPTPHVNDAPAVDPGNGPRIGLVQADFNYTITTRMADAAQATARSLGCDIVQHVHVGGVFDLPLVAKALARRADVDAVIAVGCVIQGETGHDQVIATECARKLADLSYELEKPVGLAVTGPRMSANAAVARAESVPRHAVEAVVKQWRALQALRAARVAAH